MKTRFFAILLLTALIPLFSFFWWQSTGGAVNSQDKQTKIFVVHRGESIRDVSRRLREEGLIHSQLAFFLRVKMEKAEKNIQAGTFRLSVSMTPEEIIKELAHGTLDIWVTIIEGWRAEEVAEYLKKSLPETADYQNGPVSPSSSDWSSRDGSQGGQVVEIDPYLAAALGHEGYLFPDTYLVPKGTSASAVISILLANFEKKFDKKLGEDAQKTGLSKEQTITLASIVEREAKYDDDRPVIAGILLNRLRQGMPLQADATVQYAVGYQPEQKTWWKKSLTKDDLKIDSPYNTYLNVGLPPTPISNPGLAAIKAAAQPAQTDNLYYLSDKDGRMHYAKT
ncbi:MAG: endolytic transglycosylase MltG, partial [bacterium]|nr:endolytic transglycosylase MltG [bacterium]